MSDSLTHEFFDWARAREVDLADLAPAFGLSHVNSLRNWRTAGIPKAKHDLARDIMATWGRKPVKNEGLNLEFSPDEFDEVCRAALSEGKIPREWAISQLLRLAEKNEQDILAAAEEQKQFGERTKKTPPPGRKGNGTNGK